MKILIFKILYFLKFSQFLSALFIILVGRKIYWKMLIINRCIHGFMTNLIKQSWKDSKVHAKVKVLQKERSMWVAKNVELLQVWLLTLLLYDLDAHFCSFILKVSFFLHQCTLRSPAFFWWFRPRLAYWTYMSMISNYIYILWALLQ